MWNLSYYIVHRLLHPWYTKRIPDVGKLLYKHVHSFHHKSYLPTPWNGLSLHPVEGFLNLAPTYVYLLLLAPLIPFHPVVFLF